MIFLYHIIATIASSLGLLLSFLLVEKKRIKNRRTVLFFLFLGVGMFIHLFFDAIVNPREGVISIYLNLEDYSRDLDIPYLINKLLSKAKFNTIGVCN